MEHPGFGLFKLADQYGRLNRIRTRSTRPWLQLGRSNLEKPSICRSRTSVSCGHASWHLNPCPISEVLSASVMNFRPAKRLDVRAAPAPLPNVGAGMQAHPQFTVSHGFLPGHQGHWPQVRGIACFKDACGQSRSVSRWLSLSARQEPDGGGRPRLARHREGK